MRKRGTGGEQKAETRITNFAFLAVLRGCISISGASIVMVGSLVMRHARPPTTQPFCLPQGGGGRNIAGRGGWDIPLKVLRLCSVQRSVV